jgi:hypothetical protein
MEPQTNMIASLLVDGRAVGAADGRRFDRLNPMTGAIATVASAAGLADGPRHGRPRLVDGSTCTSPPGCFAKRPR